jgi:adenylate kinase
MYKNILVMLGPQGSGKSTQTQLLAKELNYKTIIESDLLKDEIKKNTQYGKIIKKKIEKGEFVPFEITCDVLFKKIKNTKNKNIIIDGFPREIEQAHVFDYYIFAKKHNLIDVVYIDTNKDECIKRMLLRKRKDDTPKLIKKRLELYFKETIPLINYYKKKNKLIKIKGNSKRETVFKKIKEKLNIN